jgi:hypothetical protein
MTHPSRNWPSQSAHLALCVADAVRWLAWRLMTLLVEWGSVLYGLRDVTDWTAAVPRPRVLRDGHALRQEIQLGFVQIDAYLSAAVGTDDAPGDPPGPETNRRGSEGRWQM